MNSELRILHATEALGGGVTAVIDQYRTSFAGSHRILGKVRGDAAVSLDLAEGDEIVASSRQFIARLVALGRQADVIHLHSSIAGGVGRLLPRSYRQKTVYTPHALAFLKQSSTSWVFRAAERALIPRSRAFGAVSVDEAEQLAALGAAPSRVVVVPHALPPRPPSDRDQRQRVVVGVGRLAAQKDPSLFAQIAREASRLPEWRGYRWVWIGDGDADIAGLLVSSGVEVTGWLPRDEVLSHIASATLLLHTAAYEGLPMAVLEAMSLGTPVVARAIPAVRGLECEAYRTPASALQRLAALSDEEHWVGQSTRALKQVHDEYSSEAQSLQLQRLYGMVIA